MTPISDLLIHPRTRQQSELWLKRPSGSLLILGPSGSGKLKLALSIAAAMLKLKPPAKLLNYPYFMSVKKAADKQDISIEAVRGITRFMKLKTPGTGDIKRVVLIEEAQNLSLEAQNALLKALEEPNDDTAFLLTAPHALSLLPTIVSRCQIIEAYPISRSQAADYLSSRYSAKRVESAWQLSQGYSDLLQALLENDEQHPLKQAIEKAKDFLRQSVYERWLFLDKEAKNKDQLKQFLEALARVLAELHHISVTRNHPKIAKKILRDRQLVIKLSSMLERNVNPKLINLELLNRLSI